MGHWRWLDLFFWLIRMPPMLLSTMVRWRIDQAMAWPTFAAGRAKLGRAWLGFVWGPGPSSPRGGPGQAWPDRAQLQACPKPAQGGPKQALALRGLAVGQPQPPLPSQALAGDLLAEVWSGLRKIGPACGFLGGCGSQWFGGTSAKPWLGQASLQGSPNLVGPG